MSVVLTGPADLRDQRRLIELEARIETGLQTFVEVGEALMEVRNSRLYRLTHSSFEAYCRSRWGFDRRKAADLIQASAVVKSLSETTDVLPTNEFQALELAPVIRDEGVEVAAEVFAKARAATGKPTGMRIREVIEQRTTQKEETVETATSPDTDTWRALDRLMDAIDELAASDASYVAAAVFPRRRASTAKRLRKLGTYLGRVAWNLEGMESPHDDASH